MNDFKESLANYIEEKKKSEPIYKVAGIEKVAGIFVYQPTIERMSDKVREYLLNEVSFFPKSYPVDVHIDPTEMQDTKPNKNYIRNGEGIATIDMNGNVLEFPFHIRDSEFDPFFVINHKKESVPFSRENLKKIMFGIEKAQQELRAGGGGTSKISRGFKRAVKKTTPATAVGFANSGVNFRNEQKSKRGPNMMTLASNDELDNMMEKLANLREVDLNQAKDVEEKLAQRFLDREYQSSMEKIASLESSPSEYDKVNKINFIDLNQDSRVKHGDSVEVPVFDTFKGKYTSLQTVSGMFMDLNSVKGVIIKDGKFIPMTGATIGLKSRRPLKIRKENLINLNEGDSAIIKFDGKYNLIISVAEKNYKNIFGDRLTHRILDNNLSKNVTKVLSSVLGKVPENTRDLIVSFAGDSMYQGKSVSIINIPGMESTYYDREKVRASMSENDDHITVNKKMFISLIVEDIIKSGAMSYAEMTSSGLLSSIPSDSNYVIVGDINKIKAIPIRGCSLKTFKSKKEIFNLFDSTADVNMQKNASARETISLKKDLETGKFDVSINYNDKDKKIFKGMNRSLYGLEPNKLKGILTYLGYDDISADSIQNRAERTVKSSHTLPENNRANQINVGDLESRAKQRAKTVTEKLIHSGVPTAIGLAGVYGLSRGMAESYKQEKNKKKLLNFVDFIDGKATTKINPKTAAAISSQFEKIAMDNSSKSALRIAKALNVGARYFEKVAEVANGKLYNLKDISEDIVNSRDTLNKIAYQLYELYENQIEKEENIIDNAMIKEATCQIDLMLKTADIILRG